PVDATNRADNTDATSGDADATNSIGLAVSGNAALGVPACCTSSLTDIISATTITAVVAQEGDNTQTLGQNANASTGGALSGAEVIGVVSSGDASIVADNKATSHDDTSGDADADNSMDLLTVGNVATNTAIEGPGPFLPTDLVNVTGVIVQEGDNTQTQHQTANAITGDAISGGQVIGVVSSGSVSVVQQ